MAKKVTKKATKKNPRNTIAKAGGRPKVHIEQHELEALCRLNPTLKDASAFFKVHQDTLNNKAKEFGYDSFSDLRDKNMVHSRLTLVRNALKMANNGQPAMMIFCLKNLCKWSDRNEVEQVNIEKFEFVGDKED